MGECEEGGLGRLGGGGVDGGGGEVGVRWAGEGGVGKLERRPLYYIV